MKEVFSPNHYYTTFISGKFACQSCGECCKMWNIIIDEKTYQNLSKYFKEHPLPYTDQQLFIINQGENGERIITNNQINGRCIFLEDNNLCFIHRVLGSKAKSETCITYPQKHSPTPRGLFNTLSFSCPTAAKLLDYKKPFKSELFSHNLKITPAKELNYHEKEKIPWNLYFLIEEYLMNLIERKDFDFEERIAMGSFLLWNIYEDFIKVGNKKYKDIKNRLEAIKKDSYKTIYQSLKEAYSSTHIQLKFLFTLLQKRLEYIKSASYYVDDNFINFIKLAYKKFNLEEDLSKFNSRWAIKYLRVYRNCYQPYFNEVNHIFKNFVLHKIFGKEQFIKYGIIKGYHIILTLYALMRFYCMALWIDKFNYEDTFKSISFIERYYTHSPGILKFWENVDEIEIMNKPIFAYILIHM